MNKHGVISQKRQTSSINLWRPQVIQPFLGDFAKLRKLTTSFFMFACLFVRVDTTSFHWADFHEVW